MQADMEDDEFATRLIFSDEATFHLSGNENRHNVRVCGTENPHATTELQRDSPKLNVFCAISRRKVLRPVFLHEKHGHRDFLCEHVDELAFPSVRRRLGQLNLPARWRSASF
jgi:hypothetical protein